SAPWARLCITTDQLCRYVAFVIVHGARISLTIGLVVTSIQLTVGILLGGLAGYYGGGVDLGLSRFFELMLAIPTFFLILTVAAMLPPSIYNVMAILGLTGWVEIARLGRREFLQPRSLAFVTADTSLGGHRLAL